MADKIRPLKLENPALGGTETDLFPTESDPTEDYLSAKGIAFEENDGRLLDLSAGGELQWKDSVQTPAKTLNSLSTGISNARYTMVCGENSNTNATKYLSFFAGNSSNTTPFVFPTVSTLKELSVKVNGTATATFTIYKNGVSVATISLTAQTKNTASGLSIGFAIDDEMSVAITSGSANSPNVYIYIQTT